MLTQIFLLFCAFLLVLVNAFFVAAEFGMVKLRHTRVTFIEETYGLRGKILAKVHANLDAYLSACQLGITLASLGLGWLGEPAFAQLLAPVFAWMGVFTQEMTTFISFLVAFTLISFLHIVLGELVPKSLAIRQSESISLWTAFPLYIFYWLMYPAIFILNACANGILKATQMDATQQADQVYSPDEIKLILSASHIHNQLTKQEMKLLVHGVELVDLEAVDIMRPIHEMVALDADKTLELVLKTILEHNYSRYPLYDDATNDIVGIIHIKDVLAAISEGKNDTTLRSHMRQILKVESNLSALHLLNRLQEGLPHFALVYKEERPVGFVTMDNIFQVLVGRVRDEFHKIEEAWKVGPDGALLMSGSSAIYILERALGIDVEPYDAVADTLVGLIFSALGRLPEEGEEIEFDAFKLCVTKMKGHKVTEVAVYPK